MKEATEFLRLAHKKFTDSADFQKISVALDYATKKHKDQKRLSGEPYIIHPIAVATILCEWNMDRDSVVAGLLHDVAEDTGTDLKEIADKFGEDVALLVDGVTKISKVRSGRDDITHYLPRTKDNLTKLLVAIGSDVRVIIIKLADRLHNLRTLEYQSREKQLKKARESLEVFGPLADRLNMGRVRVEIEDLSFKYLAPKRYEKLRKAIDDRLAQSQQTIEQVRDEVEHRLIAEHIPASINGRIKSVYSLHKKLTKHANMDDIYDIMALRIITDDISSCYLIL